MKLTPWKSIFKESGIVAIPKYKNKIVTVDQKDKMGRNIYNVIYTYLKGKYDAGSFEVYDLGSSYIVAIIDQEAEDYSPEKIFSITKSKLK